MMALINNDISLHSVVRLHRSILLYSILLYIEQLYCAIHESSLLYSRLQIGQLPRVSREDPERIRVDSVFETSVCLFSVCSFLVSKFSHFPSFSLLFLYSTVQKSAVQYRYLFGASIL